MYMTMFLSSYISLVNSEQVIIKSDMINDSNDSNDK
jgi:hypothetical protein